ncbi:MAG: hypothetical protein E4H20_11030, partial [Spirochaetales bacterium]
MKQFLLALFLFTTGLTAWGQGPRLAITRVEPIGVEDATARLTEELLQTEFSRYPQFQLIERGRLNELLMEQELQMAGITNAESAARVGGILNVQKVVFGSIGRYDSQYVKFVLSLRIVDVERGSVEAAESVQVRTQEDLIGAVTEIVRRLAGRIELVGSIAAIDGDAVYVSLGTAAGMEPDQVLSVVQIDAVTDAAGRIVMREERPVANLVVESASLEGSRCRVRELAGELSLGMSV